MDPSASSCDGRSPAVPAPRSSGALSRCGLCPAKPSDQRAACARIRRWKRADWAPKKGAAMGLVRYRTPSGELRFWTLREIVQGKSMNRVTHPVFVIFPIALYSGALVLDVLSRLGLS